MVSTTTRASSVPALGATAALLGALAGYIIAQQPPSLQLQGEMTWVGAAALAAAAAAAFFIIRQPVIGLSLVLAVVYLNASEVLVREHAWPSLLQLLAIPLLIAAWADRSTPPLRAVLSLPLTRLLAIYTVLLLASSILALDTGLADDRFVEHTKMFVLYVTVVALASARNRLPVLAWTLVGAGTFLSAVGVVQALTGRYGNEYGGLGRIKYAHLYETVFEPRIAGPLGDPNFFAQILLIVVPVALALARWETSAVRRMLAYGTAGVIVAATVLTYSRGGAVALAAVTALSLVDRKRKWRDLGIGAALLLVLALLVPDNFMRRVTTLEQLITRPDQTLRPDSSFEKRKLLVTTAWLMFLDHPVAGVGAGNYTARFEEYADEVSSAARDYDDPAERHYPHSLYLEVAAETGGIGLLVFGAICALSLGYLARARQTFRRGGDERAAAIVRGLAVAIIGYLVSSIFLHGHFLRYLWLLFAAAGAAHLIARARTGVATIRTATSVGVTTPGDMEAPALSTFRTSPDDVVRRHVRWPIAVIVSRFPLITETFILREIEELERQGQPVVLVPLIREHRGVAHRETERWLHRLVYAPFLSPGVVTANLRAAWRNPRAYLGALAHLMLGSAHSLNVWLRTIALFPKTVYLAAHLDELGVRHVHAHFATYPAGAALTIARLSGATFSVTAHAHDIFVPWRRASLRQKIEHAQFVRTIAESGRRHLLACTGAGAASKIHVIHVGVRLEDYQLEAEPPDSGGPTLLCVAALKPYKGLAVLLEACQRLKQAGHRFRCEIVGDGPLRPAIEKLRASMSLHDQVTLRGALRQDEVTKLLARAHIVVAPSIVAPDGQMDGIPVALMEAMAAGRPVVASRLSGIPELVDDGVTGLLAEPGNAADLAEAIQRLFDDPALAARMGHCGREKIAREFRLERCVETLLDRLDAHNPSPIASFRNGWKEAIDQLVPRRAIGIRRIHERPDSTVLELVAGDGRSSREWIVKIHATRPGDRRSASQRAEHERLVLERLRSMSLNDAAGSSGCVYAVPRVFARAGTALLLECCDGTLLVDHARQARIGGRISRAALLDRVFHAGRWLRVFQQHTDCRGDTKQILQMLIEQARGHLDACVANGSLRRRERPDIETRLERLSHLTAASLASDGVTVGHHADFWPGNVVVSERRIVTIDFEGFRQGLPYEDAAYFLVQLELFFSRAPFRRFRERLGAAFLDGYRNGERVDEVSYGFCRLVKALQILAPDARKSVASTSRYGQRQRALRAIVLGGRA